MFKGIKEKLELDKNRNNPFKIFFTIIKKIINRLRNEVTEMYLFEMEINPIKELVNNGNIKFINDPKILFNFVKDRALDDKSCIEVKYYEQIVKRFNNGDFCYAFELEDSIAAVIFVSKNQVYSDAINYLFICPSKTCAIYDVYTLSKFRNRGYIKNIYDYAFTDLKNRGFNKCWIWFMPHNLATLITHKKVGFKNAIRKIKLVQKLGIRWHKIEEINLTIDDLIEMSKKLNTNEK